MIRKAASGHIKVGIASDPLQRLRELQTGSSEQLEIVYACIVRSNDGNRVELAAHDILWQRRLVGEWFDYPTDVAVAAIAAAAHRLGDPIVEVPVDRIGDVLTVAAQRDAEAAPKQPWSPARVFAVILGLSVCFAICFAFALR